jgi:hypothetical protein
MGEINKTIQEAKTEDLEWKINMLEAASICLRMYLKTKYQPLFEIYEKLMVEARYWGSR